MTLKELVENYSGGNDIEIINYYTCQVIDTVSTRNLKGYDNKQVKLWWWDTKINVKISDEPLTEKEKKYLKNIIKPFKNSVVSISKQTYAERDYEWISIEVLNEGMIDLPDFPTGKFYKSMEIEKEYTIDELGL